MTTPGSQLTPGDFPEIGDPPQHGVPDGAFVGDAGSPQSIKDLNALTPAEIARRQSTPVAVDLGSAFDKQQGALFSLLDDFALAITGQTPAGDPLQWIENWLGDERANTGAVLTDYGDLLDKKVEAWAVPTVAPLSQTINRRADPTFQLQGFMTTNWEGRYRDDDGDSGAWRTLGNSDVTRSLAAGVTTKGRTYLSFITPAINRVYSRLNFLVNSVSNPCRMDVAVYVVNDEDRTLTRMVHQTDVGATLTTGRAVATLEFPDWVATQGSYIAIAWLQHGSGNVRPLLGLNDTVRPLWDAVFPRKVSAIHVDTGMTALPESFSGTDKVSFDYWFVPYAELSENIGPEYRVFIDNFQSSGRTIARPWVSLSNYKAWVSSGGYLTVPGGLLVFNGPRVAMRETPLATDRVQSTMRVLATTADTEGAMAFTALRTSNNMATGVGVFVGWGRIQIRSWQTMGADYIYDASIVRASVAFDLSQDRTFTATWVDGEVAVYDESNTAILSWTDTTTQRIARHRFVGIGTERRSGNRAPFIDEWAARDLPPVEEESTEE